MGYSLYRRKRAFTNLIKKVVDIKSRREYY